MSEEVVIHPPCTCADSYKDDETHEIQVDVAAAAEYGELRERLAEEADAKFYGAVGGDITSEDYYHLVQRGDDESPTVESLFDTM